MDLVASVMPRSAIFSIGHSTHSYERFLGLVRSAGVNAIADVRTSPYSRHHPHFSGGPLKDALRRDGIAYAFLGRELGGRPTCRAYYRDGVADYERMAQSADFMHGLEGVLDGARAYRLALLCAERDPLDCHRCLLVSRALAARGATVQHIFSDGTIADHLEIEERLLKSEGQDCNDLFRSSDDRLAEAYRKRARRVAHAEPRDAASPIARRIRE